MALTKEDLKEISAVVTEVVDGRLESNNKKIFQEMDDRFRINNDILRQEIRASEYRLEKKIEAVKSELQQDIRQTEKRILTGVAEMIDHDILPQLDDHDTRITKFETKLA